MYFEVLSSQSTLYTLVDLSSLFSNCKQNLYIWTYYLSSAGWISFTEDITLTSTLGRRQAVCPGEVVVYTCIALHTTAVEWNAAPYVQSVIFFQDDTDTERTGGGFQLALTGRVPNGTGFSDLTATLTVTATVPLNATVIRCVSDNGRRELELMVNDVTSKLAVLCETSTVDDCGLEQSLLVESGDIN